MSKSDINSELSFTDSDHFNPSDKYLTFNILGKIYHVKQSLFGNNSDVFTDFEQFYDENRQEYIIDISPIIFEKILEYCKTEKLYQPSNIHRNYFRETLEMFHIDTSSLDVDERFHRYVSRQTIFQLIHVLLEYPDSCRIAQILHYICSIIALLSCLLISLLLTSRDPHIWNTTKTELPSNIFLIDILCLIWAIGETILRTLSTPSLYNYFTKLGLFDITGVVFHFIYIYMIGTGTKPSRCQTNPIDIFSCITFNRRLMMLNLLRKVRLVRYIRPLKHFILSLMASKKELTRLIVLISFIIALLAPLIFIVESSYTNQCSSVSTTRCIRTITDACYYLILIISTVGYGDVYPISNLAHFIAMLASPLSIMMLSVPLASVYNKYISIREIYQMQLTMPENVRYFIDDNIEFVDVTEQINQSLKYLGISQQLQEELDR